MTRRTSFNGVIKVWLGAGLDLKNILLLVLVRSRNDDVIGFDAGSF
jgi:hypothetical protein